MLKKTLFGLVILFIFVSIPVFAAEQDTDGDVFGFKAHDWSGEKPVYLDFKIPVYMEVGLYLEIDNKKDLVNTGIVIKQESIYVYTGCSIAMRIQTNFDIVMGAKIERTALGDALHDSKNTKWTVEVRDENCINKQEEINKTLSFAVEKRKIWVKLERPKLFEVDYGKNKHIANVILTVKPNWEAVWIDP